MKVKATIWVSKSGMYLIPNKEDKLGESLIPVSFRGMKKNDKGDYTFKRGVEKKTSKEGREYFVMVNAYDEANKKYIDGVKVVEIKCTDSGFKFDNNGKPTPIKIAGLKQSKPTEKHKYGQPYFVREVEVEEKDGRKSAIVLDEFGLEYAKSHQKEEGLSR